MGSQPKSADSRSHPVSSERVLVLDFGSQYAQLIARRVREQHVFCEIVRHDISAQQIQKHNPRGLILSGGPSSVYAGGRRNATRNCSSSACRSWASATACNWLARRWVDVSIAPPLGNTVPRIARSLPNRNCSTACRKKSTSG